MRRKTLRRFHNERAAELGHVFGFSARGWRSSTLVGLTLALGREGKAVLMLA